ncbi:hypothetical protein D3C83_18870 [compost metagenome]
MTGLANEVEVARLAVRMLEPEASFAEVDLARDAGVDHPLQRAVDGRAADALVFLANLVDEIVGAEMPLLAQEDVDDLLALAGALATVRLQPAEIEDRRHWMQKGLDVSLATRRAASPSGRRAITR